MSTGKMTKWGILSAGNICNDFVNAVKSTLPETEHQVVAVAARSQKSADEFAKKHGIPKAYQGYEKIAQDSDVNVVYIGSINPDHYVSTKMMINAGKHVLCEKPLGMNVREVKELIQLAKEKKVFLMEGIWSRFQPSYQQLKKEIADGTIGEVKYAHVEFGREITNPRLWKMELGGGSVLDLGIYMVQFAHFVFDREQPEAVVATGHINSEGTDDSVSAIFKYKNGRTANLTCHSKVDLPCVATVYGTKGKMSLEFPFWSAHKLTTPKGTQEFKLNTSAKNPYVFLNSPGLAYEAQHVRECINQGLTSSPVLTTAEIIEISSLMENIRKQAGVVYPQDN